jgi:glycosyltransferase involved in cell wall biosynthesis
VERPLSILFLAYRGNMRSGGQGIYLWFLARELAALGQRVTVYVGPPYPEPMPFAAEVVRLHDEHYWGKWFVRDWANFFPKPNPLRAFHPLELWSIGAARMGFLHEPLAFSLRAFHRLAGDLRAGLRFDLVHDVQSLGWGLLGVRALGLPAVSTIHHPLSVDRRSSFARDRSLREALGTMEFHPVGMQAAVARRLDRVLTSSGASLELIARDFGVRRERLVNVWNGLDTELFRPDPGVARQAGELLCVGRASDPTKGVRTAVEALALLPAPVRLTLVDDASPGNPVHDWARELGCADRLHVTGPVANAELVRLYNRAAAVLVPSRYEGFGLPAAEAMACGTPVVASAGGALAEIVRECGGGVLVPVGDAAALAKEVALLLEQPERRAALGARGRARVVERFAWPRVAEATLAVYRELLAERRGRPTTKTTSAWAGSRRANASRP